MFKKLWQNLALTTLIAAGVALFVGLRRGVGSERVRIAKAAETELRITGR